MSMYTSFDNVGLTRVLSFLKSHKSEYLSGQDLSQVLKISRVAVWKHIKKIRSLGYKIESKQNLGYKLTKDTELLLPWEITDGINTKVIGKRTYYFDILDSTQNFAAKIASNPKENGTVIISQKQTSGRGRAGRRWSSVSGGIFLSVILNPEFDISETTIFPLATSLALSFAIEKTLNLRPELKWPNDVTLHEKKVAGMLVDATVESNKIQNIILGVGINYKIDSDKLNKALKGTGNFYGVASLLKKNQSGSPKILVQAFLYELERLFDLLNQGDTKNIIREWTKRSSTLGKNVTIHTFDGKITGKAARLDNDGALIVTRKGTLERILVGDVQYIR